MDILLYNNTSERNALNKTLFNETTYTGVLKDNCSVINPIFVLYETNPTGFNYAYIAEFSRYYYIVDIVSTSNNMWEISLTCDVLMSFKTDILNSDGIIDRTENNPHSDYLQSDIWETMGKDKTDIINFPGEGFLSSGEYILLTAGG